MENHRMLGTEGAVVFGTGGGPGPTGVPNTTAAAEAARGSVPRTGVNGHGRPDPAVPEKAGGLREAWRAPGRQQHATHEPLISRAMLTEVPLAGLCLDGPREEGFRVRSAPTRKIRP